MYSKMSDKRFKKYLSADETRGMRSTERKRYAKGKKFRDDRYQVSQSESQKQVTSKDVTRFSYRKPVIYPPKFDGEASSLKLFRKQFENACQINGWSNRTEIALWLCHSLKGQALNILYDDCQELTELWRRLELRYGDKQKLSQYRLLLSRRKRQHNESLDDLASSIRTMCSVVYEKVSGKNRDEMAVMHFISSLDDVNTQYDLERQNPVSLDQAVLFAKNRETYFSDTASTYNGVNSFHYYTDSYGYSMPPTSQNGYGYCTDGMGNECPIPQ